MCSSINRDDKFITADYCNSACLGTICACNGGPPKILKTALSRGDDAVINYRKMRLEFLQKALAQDTSGDFCFRVLHPEVSGRRI